MITLQFQRSPFHPIKRTVMVPWNEIIVIQTPIVMSAGVDEVFTSPLEAALPDAPPTHDMYLTSSAAAATASSASSDNYQQRQLVLNRTISCMAHDYQVIRPVLYAPHAGKNNIPTGGTLRGMQSPMMATSSESASSIGGSGQILQETLAIPGSPVKLVYQSSSSPGFLSTIDLQLTGDHVPTSLRLVHLRIVVEGNLFTKVFEAEPQIKYTYAWNKRNVYRQKVYGLATARGMF